MARRPESFLDMHIDFYLKSLKDSGAHNEPNREPRENRGRARRCEPALFLMKREPF